MYKKTLFYGLVGCLTTGAIASLLIVNPLRAQSSNPVSDPHHPANLPVSQRTPMTDIDQHFIQMMIPHHEGSVAMAELALSRAQRPEVKQLADAIIQERNNEIEQMREWYQAWYGTEVPDMANMGRMGMGQGMMNQTPANPDSEQPMMRMEGNSGSRQSMMAMHQSMMTGNLEALQNADDFDQEFLRQMIPHHQMAVMMAQMVRETATRPETRELAQSIIDTETAEIQQMQQWYQSWYP
jgi:uncharacterized protein (DUF305 family)